MSERTRGRRPSPALIVSIVALVMSMAGTAVAARVVITSSKQMGSSTVDSRVIKNRSVQTRDLARNAVAGRKVRDGSLSLSKLDAEARSAIESPRSGSGAQALEAFRKAGPQDQAPDQPVRIATLDDVPPGTYAIFAKTILTPTQNTGGLFAEGRSVSGHCVLDAGGDRDDSRALLGTPGSLAPGALHLQITRTFGSSGTIGVDCDVTNARWNASDTSIIAVRVGRAPRTPVQG
jgi:hypothetical protein